MQKNLLSFEVPFSGFATTTFLNCFASVYLYLEGIEITGSSAYTCKQREGAACDRCGNCGNTPAAFQERYFFLFDTMCGRSALRCRFDGQPTEMQRLICETDFYDGGTEATIDFLFGFAGYAYQKLTDPAAFASAVVTSIDANRPVLAKTKAGEGRFRVLTGYDGGQLLGPDYAGVQRAPTRAPTYDELDTLYVIGKKTAPRYGFKDGLARIERVMAYNAGERLWDAYLEKMGLYTPDSLGKASLEERRARMKRVAETMWDTFNCHNFAEVFRQRHYAPLRDPAYDEFCKTIGGPCYGYTHDLAWALIGLEERADWTKHYAGYFGEMAQLTLRQIADNDAKVLAIVREMLRIVQ